MAEVNSRNFEVTISSEGVAGPAGPVGPIGPQGEKGEPGGWTTSSIYSGSLNSLTTPGLYIIQWAVANVPSNNAPVPQEGHLEVMGRTSYVMQRYTLASQAYRSQQWVRNSNDAGATWCDWQFSSTITGVGSPEGAVIAPVGARYVDKAATNGAVEWIKAVGVSSGGWRVVYGDTGWRNMNAYGAEDSGMTNPLTFTSNWSWHTTSGSRFAIRRVNERVYLMFIGNIRATASTMNSPVFNENTPVGFRASYTMVPFRGASNGTTGYFGMFSPTGPFLADAPTAGFGFGYSQGSFVTTDPWPTVLPGWAG